MSWIKKIFKRKSEISPDSRKILIEFPIHFDPDIFNSTEHKIVFDKIADKIYESVDYEDISDISDPPIRTLCYILNMHFQIENGGVIQFIDNGSGNDFDETLRSLEEINASIQARILMDVESIFPNNIVSKNWEHRRSQIDRINENNVPHVANFDSEEFWEMLDEKYYANYDSLYGAINKYTRDYMNKHNIT